MNAPEGAARLARLEAAEAEARAQYDVAWHEHVTAAARCEAVYGQWDRCYADLAALRRELAEGVQP